MNEEEAKTKWCFAAVASHTDPRTGFQPRDTPDAFKVFPCIGSACMAWRWIPLSKKSNFAAPIDGYCGLAGKP